MATSNAGRFVWHDLMTKDPKAAIAFYSEAVGWKTQPFGEGGEYTMWLGSQGPLGGVTKLPEEAAKMGAPPHWMGHVQVDNVDTAAALAKKLGGKVFKEPTDIPTVGRFAVISDPQGGSLSVFKPSGDMPLHDVTKEGEFCWNELHTTDQAAGFKFYSELLGWKKMSEMDMGPMGTYIIFGVGETQLGGVVNVSKDAGKHTAWNYYVETANLDAGLARTTKMGAKTVAGPHDVPGGRMAQLVDPQGVPFALHQGAKK